MQNMSRGTQDKFGNVYTPKTHELIIATWNIAYGNSNDLYNESVSALDKWLARGQKADVFCFQEVSGDHRSMDDNVANKYQYFSHYIKKTDYMLTANGPSTHEKSTEDMVILSKIPFTDNDKGEQWIGQENYTWPGHPLGWERKSQKIALRTNDEVIQIINNHGIYRPSPTGTSEDQCFNNVLNYAEEYPTGLTSTILAGDMNIGENRCLELIKNKQLKNLPTDTYSVGTNTGNIDAIFSNKRMTGNYELVRSKAVDHVYMLVAIFNTILVPDYFNMAGAQINTYFVLVSKAIPRYFVSIKGDKLAMSNSVKDKEHQGLWILEKDDTSTDFYRLANHSLDTKKYIDAGENDGIYMSNFKNQHTLWKLEEDYNNKGWFRLVNKNRVETNRDKKYLDAGGDIYMSNSTSNYTLWNIYYM